MTDKPKGRIPTHAEALEGLTPEDIKRLRDASAPFDRRRVTLEELGMDRQESSDTTHRIPPLQWHAMNERERMVWAANYAGSTLEPRAAMQAADKAVLALKTLQIDETEFIGPEYDACRYYSWMEYEEFKSWYPTALKIAKRGHLENADVSEAACREAYERYRRSGTDFY